jgi:hypothetical protein
LFASENEGGDGDDSKNNIAGRVDQSEDLWNLYHSMWCRIGELERLCV